MQAYELRPEAYRLLFRNARKRPHDSHVEFEKYIRDAMERWIISEDVSTFEELKQLLLLEHFCNGVNAQTSAKIREKRIKVAREAAVWADDWCLAWRGTRGKSTVAASGSHWQNARESITSGVKPSLKGSGETDQNKGYKQKPSNSRQVACYHCKEKGHIKPNCPKWKRVPSQPVSLAMSAPAEMGTGQGEESLRVVDGMPCKAVEQTKLGSLPATTTEALAGDSLGSASGSPDGPELWGHAFIHDGEVEEDGQVFSVKVFRDSGARQYLCVRLPGMPIRGGTILSLCVGKILMYVTPCSR